MKESKKSKGKSKGDRVHPLGLTRSSKGLYDRASVEETIVGQSAKRIADHLNLKRGGDGR